MIQSPVGEEVEGKGEIGGGRRGVERVVEME